MNISSIILICIVVFVIVIRLVFSIKFRKLYKSPYSLWEILNPFNTELLNIYSHLSSENKGAFWSVSTSVLIAILTCWLGFSVQYIVTNSYKDESAKLAHYEVVDKFQSTYDNLTDSLSLPFWRAMYASLPYTDSLDKGSFNQISIVSYFSDSSYIPTMLHTGKKMLEVGKEIAPYLSKEKRNELLKNNTYIFAGIKCCSSYSEVCLQDSISYVQNFIQEFYDASIQGYISMTTSDLSKLSSAMYGYYKANLELRTLVSEDEDLVALVDLLSKKQFVSLKFYIPLFCEPCVSNMKIIQEEYLSETEDTINPILVVFIWLLVCIVIGYMILRITIMRFFNSNAMSPNPRMSQSDYDKMKRQLSISEKDLSQMRVNNKVLQDENNALEKKIMFTELELKNKEKKLNEIEERLSSQTNHKDTNDVD